MRNRFQKVLTRDAFENKVQQDYPAGHLRSESGEVVIRTGMQFKMVEVLVPFDEDY